MRFLVEKRKKNAVFVIKIKILIRNKQNFLYKIYKSKKNLKY